MLNVTHSHPQRHLPFILAERFSRHFFDRFELLLTAGFPRTVSLEGMSDERETNTLLAYTTLHNR
jgi:hypothetical protein